MSSSTGQHPPYIVYWYIPGIGIVVQRTCVTNVTIELMLIEFDWDSDLFPRVLDLVVIRSHSVHRLDDLACNRIRRHVGTEADCPNNYGFVMIFPKLLETLSNVHSTTDKSGAAAGGAEIACGWMEESFGDGLVGLR